MYPPKIPCCAVNTSALDPLYPKSSSHNYRISSGSVIPHCFSNLLTQDNLIFFIHTVSALCEGVLMIAKEK